ncbi:hypothetical protein ACE193_11780 [Bernardetia sp. OM2101]|uniref:PBECR3 domain-containing polyvalent protein n=1 Tax=Bernardetia sp. OM2101 TaxID=3344876 RepID=UPI0035CFAB18
MESIKEFIEKVLEDVSKFQRLDLGELSEKQIAQINENLEINLEGFKRVLDNSGVLHCFKEHGDKIKEEARGQLAITKEDFEKIIDVVENPDKIQSLGKNRLGKEYDYILCYVESVRESKKKKRKELVLETLYKKKPSKRLKG